MSNRVFTFLFVFFLVTYGNFAAYAVTYDWLNWPARMVLNVLVVALFAWRLMVRLERKP